MPKFWSRLSNQIKVVMLMIGLIGVGTATTAWASKFVTHDDLDKLDRRVYRLNHSFIVIEAELISTRQAVQDLNKNTRLILNKLIKEQ